jgi:hypothetical protein
VLFRSIIVKQLIHCKDDIESDFPSCDLSQLVSKVCSTKKYSFFQYSDEHMLDYNCIITLANCEQIGGYRIIPHPFSRNNQEICKPNFMYSDEGYKLNLEQAQVFCPICYTSIDASNFAKVNPKVDINSPLLEQITIDFSDNKMIEPIQSASKPSINSTFNFQNKFNKTGILIKLRGTIGQGKSTYAYELEQKLNKFDDVFCVNEGTDKYCKEGCKMPEAVSMVTNAIMKVNRVDKFPVVIIDTCGEHNTSNVIFSYDFTDWEQIVVCPNYTEGTSNFDALTAWTIRNMLRRTESGKQTNYWLNPVNAGVNTCLTVHFNKSKAVYKKTIKKPYKNSSKTVEQILADVEQLASTYTPDDLDAVTNEMVKRIMTFRQSKLGASSVAING